MSKIYVANLSAYVAGFLRGEWFDLDDYSNAEEFTIAIQDANIAHPNGETAIHDYEGFGGCKIEEYASLEFVFRLHELVEEHGVPFAVFAESEWASPLDTADDLDAAESAFTDAWIGNVSAEDHARDYVTECLEISGTALEYFDFERFARDMVLGGDVSEHIESGEYYLFRAV